MLLQKSCWRQPSVSVTNLVVRLKSSKSSASDDYQYIQKSQTKTLHFQPSLPRLPIPELSKSCARYLRAQRPMLTHEEYERVEKIVNKFEKEDGVQLQKALIDKDKRNKRTSYICEPWFELYLKDRKPIPINYNPFLVFINDPRPEYNSQLLRATNLLVSSARFMKSLRAQLLEPEVFHLNPKKSDTEMFRTVTRLLPSAVSWYGAYLFKAFPLDMSQYEKLFNTSRIPQEGQDKLYHDASQRHIVVMKGGNLYSVEVLDDSGNIKDPLTLLTCLNYILTDTRAPASHPVGALTSENRDVWAAARKHLESLGDNQQVFRTIDGSLFNLVLDEDNVSADQYIPIVRSFLHSDASNRWFDKCFSLIVNKVGLAGVNFEHSWGDGVAVLRYFQDIYKDSTSNTWVHPDSQLVNCSPETLVKPLHFTLDDQAKQSIEKALANYRATTEALDINLVEYNRYGRDLCKPANVSPDCLMQLSFQIANHHLTGKPAPTYESCSTAAFKHGRTETMRPCTIEAQNFCKALSKKAPKDELRRLLLEASKVHGNLIKEAAMGQGFDRHMFALKLQAEELGRLPAIFQDPTYQRLNHYILSTSTLVSDVLLAGGFGPVVRDGYGIGYSIWKDRLGSIVTNYRDGGTDGPAFTVALQGAFDQLHHVLK